MGPVRVGRRRSDQRNARRRRGAPGAQPMLFCHGFGCDQHMWRSSRRRSTTFRVVIFDHVGAGGSDLAAYDPDRYASLDGYADDVLEICDALDLRRRDLRRPLGLAMIGVLAAVAEPDRFAKLVLVGPSPRYIDDEATSAGSARPTSTSCSTRSTATTSAGRARWRR